MCPDCGAETPTLIPGLCGPCGKVAAALGVSEEDRLELLSKGSGGN